MTAMVGQAFSWRQFRVMLRVIRKGEQHSDNTGMGLGGDDATTPRGLAGRVGGGLRRVAMAFLFLILAAVFFVMGLGMGAVGVQPYVAQSLSVVCLVSLTVLTGLYQAVNVLYFVRDLGYYLTLPISATTIMWAKLVHFLALSVLGDLILAPIPLGCLLAWGAPWPAWVLSVVAYVLCAVAVNLALVIVCVPIMRFSRLAHDKDRFSRVFGALIVVLALAVGLGSQFALRGDGLVSLAAGADELLSGGVPTVVMGVLCPPTLFMRQLLEGDALGATVGLVLMVASVALYAAVLSALARRWYFEGVQALQGAGSKRGRRVEGAELARATSVRGQLAANLSRDWKTMVRVPVFFNQFVLSSLLMPLYFVVIAVASSVLALSEVEQAGISLPLLLEMVRGVTATFTPGSAALLWCAVGVLGFSLLLGFSSYSFTMGVSRDGSDFFFLRALPMDWGAYLLAKFVSPYLLSTVPMLVLVVAALVVLGVPAVSGTCLVLVYLGATAALGLLSLGVGALFPRLDWESEAQLVKGGAATLIVFAGLIVGVVSMALPALALLAGCLWGALDPLLALVLALALFALECAGLVWWLLGPCARHLSRLER
ncbi:hypothetical protein [Olsenella profusa]|uniref:ABC-2 type transport system permease protein n=1 Tax=Olsenella profusa TaxID=138595 RepID=A0ABS2F2D9_9ACTN|nr:hypothetical protein [Olsenella profusa]MBM6775161.1 hypothetical protein [Olsenella profusa]